VCGLGKSPTPTEVAGNSASQYNSRHFLGSNRPPVLHIPDTEVFDPLTPADVFTAHGCDDDIGPSPVTPLLSQSAQVRFFEVAC